MLHADGLTAPRRSMSSSGSACSGLGYRPRRSDRRWNHRATNAVRTSSRHADGRTVLEPGEDANSPRVREAVGPWQVVNYPGHTPLPGRMPSPMPEDEHGGGAGRLRPKVNAIADARRARHLSATGPRCDHARNPLVTIGDADRIRAHLSWLGETVCAK
jgi:hypothetical protein